MQRVSIGPGVTAASFAAGPLFIATAFISEWFERASRYSGDPSFGAVVAIAPFAILFGASVAVLPNLFGAKLLGELGWQNAGARLPPVWALVGAGFGALFGSAFKDTDPVIAVVGGCCALICRWGTRWDD